MTDPQYGEALPLQHHYVSDARFTHRYALAIVWLTTTRSASLIVALAFAAIGTMGLLGTLLGLLLTAVSGEWYDMTPFLIALGASLVLLGLMFGVGYITARGALDRLYPIGSTFAAGLGETALALSMPGTVGELDYRSFRKVIRVGEFIYLPARFGTRRTVLPAQIVPGTALDELRDRIADAQS